jgi:hypothetical protein
MTDEESCRKILEHLYKAAKAHFKDCPVKSCDVPAANWNDFMHALSEAGQFLGEGKSPSSETKEEPHDQV